MSKTMEPTTENQVLALNFTAWDAATMAAFTTTCEAVCRALLREGNHPEVAEAFEGLALRGGELVRVKAAQEGEQRQRHSLN